MSELSTGQPSGLKVSHDGTTWVAIPQAIEAVDGTASERKAVLEGFIADMRAKGPALALVRATAAMAGGDPTVAERATDAPDAPVSTAAPSTQPGGAR